MPAYLPITDAEIAPGKPVTRSLLARLRDNVLALLTQDPTAIAAGYVIPPVLPERVYVRSNAAATTWTVPTGVRRLWVILRGGGGGGGGSGLSPTFPAGYPGGEGGLGVFAIAVNPGDVVTIAGGGPGSGGGHFNPGTAGGASSVIINGTMYIANGGSGGGAGGVGSAGAVGTLSATLAAINMLQIFFLAMYYVTLYGKGGAGGASGGTNSGANGTAGAAILLY